MIDAAILDGDTVILARPKSLSQIKKNDMVAAWLVNEETTTLKHYVPQSDGSVWLVPANPDHSTYKPLVIREPAKELEIHGIVVSVMRTY
jgi:SOS-response transcriptional repressor LexA